MSGGVCAIAGKLVTSERAAINKAILRMSSSPSAPALFRWRASGDRSPHQQECSGAKGACNGPYRRNPDESEQSDFSA
jgi:hypothetical protein